MDPERLDDWIAELNSPPTGRDPDVVGQQEIETEMALFQTAAQVLH